MAAYPLDEVDELFEFGVQAYRSRLRREHPALGEAELDDRVAAWLTDRPGAPLGDGHGRPVAWPRR